MVTVLPKEMQKDMWDKISSAKMYGLASRLRVSYLAVDKSRMALFRLCNNKCKHCHQPRNILHFPLSPFAYAVIDRVL